MKFSYSRVDCYLQCPYRYYLRYIQKLTTYDENDPQDPLKLGTALHKGIETDVETAINEYYMSYPVISDKHVEEAIKLAYWIPKVKELLPIDGQNEVKIECKDFIGYIDYLVKNEDGTYDIYDFKYSNNSDRYLESKQLHVYKVMAEKILNIKVKNVYFIVVPKIMIRQKKTESTYEFRTRLKTELEKKDIKLLKIDFDKEKFKEFQKSCKDVETCKEFTKNPSKLCDWCEYKDYCLNGNSLNIVNKMWYEKEEN